MPPVKMTVPGVVRRYDEKVQIAVTMRDSAGEYKNGLSDQFTNIWSCRR